MPPLRPLVRHFSVPSNSSMPALLALRTFSLPSATSSTSPGHNILSPATQQFSTSSQSRSEDAHGSHYDPPSGWLYGVPPGEKYKKEGWETLWFYGFYGSLGLAAVAYAYKPDSSIQTWALEEARRRLEAEGILPDPSAPGAAK